MGRVSDVQADYETKGEVKVLADVSDPAIVTDGPCLQQTLVNLRRGVGGKPMKDNTLLAARSQAINFLGEIVKHYATDVAPNEVGAGGTGQASAASPLAGRCPTGPPYGRVQSGKTLR